MGVNIRRLYSKHPIYAQSVPRGPAGQNDGIENAPHERDRKEDPNDNAEADDDFLIT